MKHSDHIRLTNHTKGLLDRILAVKAEIDQLHADITKMPNRQTYEDWNSSDVVNSALHEGYWALQDKRDALKSRLAEVQLNNTGSDNHA